MLTWYCLELVYSKNYFNLTKIFVLSLFKMAAIQTVCSRQMSIIKFLLAEKCKPCDIYRRMCDVYRETCFSHKKMLPA